MKIATKWYQAIAFAWGLGILFLSAMPGKYFPTLDWGDLFTIDKWIHAFLYGVWVWLIVKAFPNTPKIVWIAAGIAFSFGYAMELGQAYLFEGRAYELSDQVANSFGIVVAIWMLRKKLMLQNN
jgi:hypothetical protein